MNIIKGFRFLFVLVLALSALGIFAPAALADAPVKAEFKVSGATDLSNVCPFTFNLESTLQVQQLQFLDENGNLLRESDHIVQVDVFSANGKTLTSMPYVYNVEWILDSSGNLVHAYFSGIGEKVKLPDGSFFTSAGRSDSIEHPGEVFFVPDVGHAHNLDGLCAALAP